MKNFFIRIFLLILFLVVVMVSSMYAQSLASSYQPGTLGDRDKTVMQNNEFNRSEKGQNATIYCNPLLLDGQPLNYGKFTSHSRGILQVVEGNPASVSTVAIPFHIYLRRNGQRVAHDQMSLTKKQYHEIELSQVLAYSQPGDQLIIDPVQEEYWKAKRILKIIE